MSESKEEFEMLAAGEGATEEVAMYAAYDLLVSTKCLGMLLG